MKLFSITTIILVLAINYSDAQINNSRAFLFKIDSNGAVLNSLRIESDLSYGYSIVPAQDTIFLSLYYKGSLEVDSVVISDSTNTVAKNLIIKLDQDLQLLSYLESDSFITIAPSHQYHSNKYLISTIRDTLSAGQLLLPNIQSYDVQLSIYENRNMQFSGIYGTLGDDFPLSIGLDSTNLNIFITGYTVFLDSINEDLLYVIPSRDELSILGDVQVNTFQKNSEGANLAIDMAQSELDINIFPNPLSQLLCVELTLGSKKNHPDLTYSIYSIDGRLILSGNLKELKNYIDVSNLKSGTYCIKILDKNENILTVKFIQKN